ncbi:MAG: hypothetical protein HY869_19945 [Chloroflexi bacterium]|nr:hypothetical protein [Chloroflexota bacterium]
MSFLENFVLDIPYLFLKKIPYSWFFAIIFLTWAPALSALLVLIIALGLWLMALQQRFWEAKIQREFQKEGTPYRVQPRMPIGTQLQNAAWVLAGSLFVAFMLHDRLNMTGVQWFLLTSGFMFLYRDAMLFGATAVYLVTPRGIGARYIPGHVDYRLFIRYTEINYVTRIRAGDKLPTNTSVLSPVRGRKEGILLVAKLMDGFSNQLGQILLTPDDPEAFLAQIPATLIQEEAHGREVK